jgi:hypothetical protein
MPRRTPLLLGVFFVTCSVLVFQTVQTRILSVIAWYYLAFFAISVAMLGMTAGAVWVYFNRARLTSGRLATALSDSALLAAIAMPLSVMVQFSLITALTPTVTSLFAGGLLMAAMTAPYVFAGITVSIALTRTPFPISQIYAVDLLGAALGCAAVVGLLDIVDGPSAILVAGTLAALAAYAFARSATGAESQSLMLRRRWQRPLVVTMVLAVLIPVNLMIPVGFKPVMVKDQLEDRWLTRTERWNSYSRIVAYRPITSPPFLWGPSPLATPTTPVPQGWLNIDGAAGTPMPHYDGTDGSIDYLRYDLVNLAYYLPGITKSAVIGVGGGRDLMSAHLFGVRDITGVELNPIFIDLLTKNGFYASLSNLNDIPNLRLHVDDARSWFAAAHETFDLIQMSMIDTWAATGAGAFSLSENGLYTLEGWRAFLNRLSDEGVFTVSRWYNRGDVDESGRMIALAIGTMIDRGAADPRQHIFVARTDNIATLVLSKAPLSAARLAMLKSVTTRLGFKVLVTPDAEPETDTLRRMVVAKDMTSLNRVAQTTFLDLRVPTDQRPFFFNQLRFTDIPRATVKLVHGELAGGVLRGNLLASITLTVILVIALIAVVFTIVLPLRGVAKTGARQLIVAGTIYFSLIGMGFMFAEIALLQYFGIFLGHPIYALGVCLFSLILSSGLGSLASGRFGLDTGRRVVVWGVVLAAYLLVAQGELTRLFAAASSQDLAMRILLSLAVIMPVGFLMGFGFPTGMTLIQRIDNEPAPWFWGINGATGVLASVVAVMVSMGLGINVTMSIAGLCYLAVIPAARVLMATPTARPIAVSEGLQRR